MSKRSIHYATLVIEPNHAVLPARVVFAWASDRLDNSQMSRAAFTDHEGRMMGLWKARS